MLGKSINFLVSSLLFTFDISSLTEKKEGENAKYFLRILSIPITYMHLMFYQKCSVRTSNFPSTFRYKNILPYFKFCAILGPLIYLCMNSILHCSSNKFYSIILISRTLKSLRGSRILLSLSSPFCNLVFG